MKKDKGESMTKLNWIKGIEEKINKILYSRVTNYGIKCPYCKFKPTEHLTKHGKEIGVIQHVVKTHLEKHNNKTKLLLDLFTQTLQSQKQERIKYMEGLKKTEGILGILGTEHRDGVENKGWNDCLQTLISHEKENK